MKQRLTTSSLLLLLCFATQAQTPTRQSPEEQTTGTLSGKVVNENGQPLPGASLFVRAINSTSTGRNTTSDADGNFRVNGLEPALYSVTAFAPAYTTPPDLGVPAPSYRLGDSVRVELVRGGAITGSVTNALGEPVIAISVRATLIRDAKGQTPKAPTFGFSEQPSDDRGIYRIYGLAPGTYLVSAGGSSLTQASQFSPYETDVPTYSPSATRDNAAEVSVRSGEDSNADIRYQSKQGHTISGTVKTSGTAPTQIAQIALMDAGNSLLPIATALQFPGNRGFALPGLADGDYDIVAQEITGGQASSTPEVAVSEAKRITLKGANVTGIELVTRPLATVSGRISLETSKAPECKGKRAPLFAETLVHLSRNEKDSEQGNSPLVRMFGTLSTPDPSGAFVSRNLTPGRYQFEPRFYARYWYLKSIGMTPKVDAAANWTVVRFGDRLTNLIVTLAEGAASIRGSLPLSDGASAPAGLIVYLTPSEPDKAEDVLRFFVSEIAADGTFALNNLAPGRYWLFTQTTDDTQPTTLTKLRRPEAATARTKLRRTGETQKTAIELKPCQNLTDFRLSMKN